MCCKKLEQLAFTPLNRDFFLEIYFLEGVFYEKY